MPDEESFSLFFEVWGCHTHRRSICRCPQWPQYGIRSLALELQAVVKGLAQVLGDKLRSSERPNHWAVSPAPRTFISDFCHHLGCYWCCCSDVSRGRQRNCFCTKTGLHMRSACMNPHSSWSRWTTCRWIIITTVWVFSPLVCWNPHPLQTKPIPSGQTLNISPF